MNDSNPARDLWYAAIELMRAEGSVFGAQEAFIRLAQPITAIDDVFVIAVGSDFVKNWLEEHVASQIESKLSDILARPLHLEISVDPTLTEIHTDGAAQRVQPQRSSYVPSQTPEVATNRDSAISRLMDSSPAQYASFDQREENEPHFPSSYDRETVESPIVRNSSLISDPTSYESTPLHGGDNERNIYGSSSVSRNKDQLAELSLKAQLNPHNTFDSFVVGDSNRFAHATSFAVAEAPGTTYNPLFLYSESGMGKTHLMHAIGNYALSLDPSTRILYVTSEDFTSHFTDSVKSGRMAEFKNQFRTVDILLIDDIQFIGGKTGTVDEFFHTFNALTNANKQIVITSDVPPSLLKGFEERLLSRFNSGVTADIDRPNLETGVAILEKKAIADGIHVPRDVLEYIASNITTNIREMEGALRNVTAFAGLSNQAVDLHLSEMVLKDLISNPEHVVVTAGLIMAQTANYFQLSIDDLTSPDRSRGPATARQVAMFLCRQMTDLSLPKIGEIFGGRDHTTVIHAYNKINKQMSEKQTTYNQVQELSSRIKQAAKNASPA